jgi:hypothetical protein
MFGCLGMGSLILEDFLGTELLLEPLEQLLLGQE